MESSNNRAFRSAKLVHPCSLKKFFHPTFIIASLTTKNIICVIFLLFWDLWEENSEKMGNTRFWSGVGVRPPSIIKSSYSFCFAA